MIEGKLFVTGGAGTLGQAIIKRAIEEQWPCEITVFSRDPMKHHALKRIYPQVTCVVGDITDYSQVYLAMTGHDIVIHCAAMKHIPEAEDYPIACYNTNVVGSLNVLSAAVEIPSIRQVIGISTDKVCYSVNAYGTTKFMMERAFQRYSKLYPDIKFNLVRYGNVIGSTGSVVQVWRQMLESEGKVYATDPDMTRFWFTVDDAVEVILISLHQRTGTIVIPQLPALSMKDMARFVLPPETEIIYEGLRPGEKRHEVMLTEEEGWFADGTGKDGEHWFVLRPTNEEPYNQTVGKYASNAPVDWYTEAQFKAMIGE